MRIESRPWAFQGAINQGRASPLTSPEWGSITQICCFHTNFDQKPLTVCYIVSLSKNFQLKSSSAINYLTNGMNILTGDDPLPYNLGLKAPTSNRRDVLFTFHMRCTVQSAIADLLVLLPNTCGWQYSQSQGSVCRRNLSVLFILELLTVLT